MATLYIFYIKSNIRLLIFDFLFTGRSHDRHFKLFRLGQKSSAGIKTFAESGKTDTLEEQSQGEGGVYDEFTAPPVTSGVGRTETDFFVDGNHSKVNKTFVDCCAMGLLNKNNYSFILLIIKCFIIN